MAKTNWQDPKTSEMRSTHIAGLMEAVGKVEDSIGMESVFETNIPLTEVFISSDDRYRIFQAPEGKRNWTSEQPPVIKRNGTVISSGFEVDYGGGAIVLNVNDTVANTYTADVAYIKKTEISSLKTQRFVIGTSTSGWTEKDCDYLCDGTNDQEEIIQALNDLPATGGEVVILDGTYNITASINIPKDNVNIRGNGNATILKRMFDSSIYEGVITLTSRSGCKIANLQIEGNKTSYTKSSNCGIYLGYSSNNTITGNTCNNNSSGICLNSSNNNTVTCNTCIRGIGTPEDYTTNQHTILLSGTGNDYNLISSNNCMGKAPVVEGGTGNSVFNNKWNATSDFEDLRTDVGDKTTLTTTDKTNLVNAINEVKEQNNDLEADRKKYAEFRISANQSIPNATDTQIAWSTKTPYNGEDFCEIDATTNRIKILKTGMYQIDLSLSFAGNATGIRSLWTANLMNYYPNAAGSPCYTYMGYFIYVTVGTLLNIRCSQTSGGALDVLTSGTACKIRKVV